MDAGQVLRSMTHLHQHHQRRQSEFTVPSAVHVGHEVTVRRLDEHGQPVSQADIHLLMHANVAPGATSTLKSYTGKLPNKYVVYMSATPGCAATAVPEPAKIPPRKDSWIDLNAVKAKSTKRGAASALVPLVSEHPQLSKPLAAQVVYPMRRSASPAIGQNLTR